MSNIFHQLAVNIGNKIANVAGIKSCTVMPTGAGTVDSPSVVLEMVNIALLESDEECTIEWAAMVLVYGTGKEFDAIVLALNVARAIRNGGNFDVDGAYRCTDVRVETNPVKPNTGEQTTIFANMITFTQVVDLTRKMETGPFKPYQLYVGIEPETGVANITTYTSVGDSDGKPVI
ncbi:MAG: hypothetical protein AAF352_04845 [Pseudomonadota bacterium]